MKVRDEEGDGYFVGTCNFDSGDDEAKDTGLVCRSNDRFLQLPVIALRNP